MQNYGNLAASLQRSFGMEPTAEALAIAEAQRQQLEGQGQEGQGHGGEAEARSGEVGTSQRVQVGGEATGAEGARKDAARWLLGKGWLRVFCKSGGR